MNASLVGCSNILFLFICETYGSIQCHIIIYKRLIFVRFYIKSDIVLPYLPINKHLAYLTPLDSSNQIQQHMQVCCHLFSKSVYNNMHLHVHFIWTFNATKIQTEMWHCGRINNLPQNILLKNLLKCSPAAESIASNVYMCINNSMQIYGVSSRWNGGRGFRWDGDTCTIHMYMGDHMLLHVQFSIASISTLSWVFTSEWPLTMIWFDRYDKKLFLFFIVSTMTGFLFFIV